jgi:hypothetical protein
VLVASFCEDNVCVFVIIYGFYDYIYLLLYDMMAWSHWGLFFSHFGLVLMKETSKSRFSLILVSLVSFGSHIGLFMVSLERPYGLIWCHLGLLWVLHK